MPGYGAGTVPGYRAGTVPSVNTVLGSSGIYGTSILKGVRAFGDGRFPLGRDRGVAPSNALPPNDIPPWCEGGARGARRPYNNTGPGGRVRIYVYMSMHGMIIIRRSCISSSDRIGQTRQAVK